MASGQHYFVGVDVGTASVRAALVTHEGRVKNLVEEPIHIWEPHADQYVQSSEDIWAMCCSAVRKVTMGVKKDQVRGIGFDATCSLVVLDQNFQPVAVNEDGICDRNVVMWMDHRAAEQAARITATGHAALKRVGGVMSPEMQPPKLLWLKENLMESCWKDAAHFFDLPDFLSWKATGSLSRSLCTLVCKWTYSPPDGWDDTFWTTIGLADLLEENYFKIGSIASCPGVPVGAGLTQEAAADLGLNPGVAVGTSLIDAHAGGLGVIGADVAGFRLPREGQPIASRMALICGTSSCHMAISRQALFVPGVWGPYQSAMVPGFWLNEGGQSATGKLIDHIVKSHPAHTAVQERAEKSGEGLYSFLNHHLETMATDPTLPDLLTSNLHVWPDFHGNRSPLADPALKGMVVGLSLGQTADDLALLYLATLQALALGTRHILQAMREAGHDITTLFLCGGLSKNRLFVWTHANATGLPVVLPAEREAVLVGAAMLGACASGHYGSIQEAMEKMGRAGTVVEPRRELARFYGQKFRVFLRLCDHQREYVRLMQEENPPASPQNPTLSGTL
ncbi:FGGY carbohydrate kinase domain-containing protein [Denticeps clupeoides]|uniref:FGGY carbohydrate kinase domain-containing protein n=1 Tax=Denticeps clupeoides TaxID=299321 RepID=A0AAY4AVW5_9TELE|nr:FGGY carbohydrate kinase domain-containing protein [Denticeps clupeoides]XP_028833178.1 FGGY carbohydrate kinase domain-containing protein [Denticeps clupeoides]